MQVDAQFEDKQRWCTDRLGNEIARSLGRCKLCLDPTSLPGSRTLRPKQQTGWWVRAYNGCNPSSYMPRQPLGFSLHSHRTGVSIWLYINVPLLMHAVAVGLLLAHLHYAAHDTETYSKIVNQRIRFNQSPALNVVRITSTHMAASTHAIRMRAVPGRTSGLATIETTTSKSYGSHGMLTSHSIRQQWRRVTALSNPHVFETMRYRQP
jgi:hypothetical protein